MVSALGKRGMEDRRYDIINAIPMEWCLRQDKALELGEWMAVVNTQDMIKHLFQLQESTSLVRNLP